MVLSSVGMLCLFYHWDWWVCSLGRCGRLGWLYVVLAGDNSL